MRHSPIFRWMKRHALLPFALVAVILFGYTAADLYAAKDEGTFRLVDLYGDRSELDGITVQGVLGDAYHRTSFRITADGLSHETELFDQYREPVYYSEAFGKIFGRYRYEVRNYDYETGIAKRGLEPPYDHEAIAIRHGYANHDANGNSRYSNPAEYGLASVNGQVFYVMPTSLYHQGKNVIYKLDYEAEEPEAHRFIELDMSGNDPERSRGLEVLGLESVDDQLVLILAEDRHKLIIRGYDSENGEFLGEAAIDGFMGQHSEQYEAYIDHDHRLINLSVRRKDGWPSQNQPAMTMLSFDLSEGIRLVDQVSTVFEDGEWESWDSEMLVNHVHGKTVVLMTVREPRVENGIPVSVARPIRFMLYVFDDGELSYKGEFISDQNDDLIHFRNHREGIGYDTASHREYEQLGIEGRSGLETQREAERKVDQ